LLPTGGVGHDAQKVDLPFEQRPSAPVQAGVAGVRGKLSRLITGDGRGQKPIVDTVYND
jgi:hypothetical protein